MTGNRTTLSFRPTGVNRIAVVLLPVLVVLAGCGSDDEPVSTDDTGSSTTSEPEPTSAPEPSEPVEYRSVSVTENGQDRPLVAGTIISLRLDGSTVGASLGCNSLGGDYHLDGDGHLIVDGGLSMTEMGCDQARHEQDQWFADFLLAGPSFDDTGDGLVLATDTTTVEFVERSVVDPDRPLLGTRWVADGFLDGDSASSLATDSPAEITFDGDTGTASGTDGCNSFSAEFELDGDELRFGSVSTTDRACPGTEDYQGHFHAILVSRVTVEITAARLTLLADDGRGVTFVAAE